MAGVSRDIKNLPPEQRIRVLREIEEEKKKELKKKQKELEELEKQKKKEADEEKKDLEEAEALIRESIDEIAKEQERAFKEIEKQRNKERAKLEEEDSLESKLEDSPLTKTKQYTSFLEQIKEEATLYNLTNYNTYKEVGTLREKAMREGLNEREEELLNNLKYKLEEAQGNSMYKERDSQEGNYFSRLSKAITQIEEIQKDIDKRTKQTMYSSN